MYSGLLISDDIPALQSVVMYTTVCVRYILNVYSYNKSSGAYQVMMVMKFFEALLMLAGICIVPRVSWV